MCPKQVTVVPERPPTVPQGREHVSWGEVNREIEITIKITIKRMEKVCEADGGRIRITI